VLLTNVTVYWNGTPPTGVAVDADLVVSRSMSLSAMV
jgi:hypothetical protein